MAQAKANWEGKMDSTPTCSRCGHPIDKSQKMTVSGMMRLHEVCPSAAEASAMLRNTRFFLRKLPERLVLTMTTSTDETDRSHDKALTFMFDIDREAVEAMAKRAPTDSLVVHYVPDQGVRASLQRKFEADEATCFDLGFRDFFPMSYMDPKTGIVGTPEVYAPPDASTDEPAELTFFKYHHSNGVLKTVRAEFIWSRKEQLLTPRELSVTLDMWLVDDVVVHQAPATPPPPTTSPSSSNPPQLEKVPSFRRPTYVAKRAKDFDVA